MILRWFTLCFLIALFSSPAMAVEIVFRNAMWGASKADLKKYETALFDREDGNRLYFFDTSEGFRTRITYEFKDDKLWRGVAEYRELHYPDPQLILDLFGQKQAVMEKKWGKPSREEFLWNDEVYKYYPQFWGRSLRSGDLRIRMTWETGESRIFLETYHRDGFYQIITTAEQKSIADARQNQPFLLLQDGNDNRP